MNDLLFAVKGGSNGAPGGGAGPSRPPPGGGGRDVEAGYGAGPSGRAGSGTAPGAPGRNPEMEEFFARADDIKAEMAGIREKQREIRATHERGKTIVRQREMQRHREDMQALINEVSAAAHRVKGKVDALDRANEAALAKKGQGLGSASERTRTSISAGLKRKLKDLMAEFSALRTQIQDEYREVVERRVYTVTGQHVPEEDIDRLIESGEAETIFQKAILEQGRGRVLDTLAEIQERHRAVKDLEASLLELHQIFLDMAVLVEAQGEMLDNIERQVARSVEYVQSGTSALQDAKQLQKNTRKWMCCGIITLLIVAVIIVLVVVKPWQFAARNNNNGGNNNGGGGGGGGGTGR